MHTNSSVSLVLVMANAYRKTIVTLNDIICNIIDNTIIVDMYCTIHIYILWTTFTHNIVIITVLSIHIIAFVIITRIESLYIIE